ncbi:MAG: hypothetical protein ACREQZ_05800 [Woeseiaceae bacterium]
MWSAAARKPLIHRLIVVLSSAALGAFLGYASAQDTAAGRLDPDCAGRCTANGYEAEFCQSVCWVPDPAEAAEGDRLDWKCFEACAQRGGKARDCVASCRR